MVMEKEINFDEWAEELQGSKLDLIELLQTHMELAEKVEKIKEIVFGDSDFDEQFFEELEKILKS
jgi:hypothetical protein